MPPPTRLSAAAGEILVNIFRNTYRYLENTISATITAESIDSTVLERLREELVGHLRDVTEFHYIFAPEEFAVLCSNIALLQAEIVATNQRALEVPYHGKPSPAYLVRSGGPGRPRIHIDEDWLRSMYAIMSTSDIARTLSVSRPVVRSALLDYGIAEPGEQPIIRVPASSSLAQSIREARMGSTSSQALTSSTSVNLEDLGPTRIQDEFIQLASYTPPQSLLTDAQLDAEISRLRIHFPSHGISMMQGSLTAMGHRVSQQRVRQSLIRTQTPY